MSTEAIACAQDYKGLDAVLDRLPPKIIEIDGDGPREADADEVGGGDEGRGPRIERVRASIKAATFTGKGDDKVGWSCITITLEDWQRDGLLARRWSRCMRVSTTRREREGYGTLRFATYNVTRGVEGKERGRGTYRFADGDV